MKNKSGIHFNESEHLEIFIKEMLGCPNKYVFNTMENMFTISLPTDIDKVKVQKEIYEWLKRRV